VLSFLIVVAVAVCVEIKYLSKNQFQYSRLYIHSSIYDIFTVMTTFNVVSSKINRTPRFCRYAVFWFLNLLPTPNFNLLRKLLACPSSDQLKKNREERKSSQTSKVNNRPMVVQQLLCSRHPYDSTKNL